VVLVIVVVRECGGLDPEYSLSFKLPAVPEIGSYISIHRPNYPPPLGEDLIVRNVWWRLHHSETRSSVTSHEKEQFGDAIEIFVECDRALGPYASDHWRQMMERAKGRGVHIEDFQVSRVCP
jgi:hypothetical protein